jgi:cilia- and flagella-associated protein 57
VEGSEVKLAIPTAPNDGFPIKSVLSFSKGFIAGCSDATIRIFEKSSDVREVYKRTKRFKISNQDTCVVGLALSPSEDTLICTLENGQAFTLSLSNTELSKPGDVSFEPLLVSFPAVGKGGSKAITGMDTCLRKPLVVTVGTDRTLRLWNYAPVATNKPAGEFIPALDLVKILDDDPTACVVP